MVRNLKPTLALLLVTLGILGCDNGNREQPSGVDNSVIGEWRCNMDGFDTTLSFRDGKVAMRMSNNTGQIHALRAKVERMPQCDERSALLRELDSQERELERPGSGIGDWFDGAYEFDQRSRVFSATTIGLSGRLDEQGRLLVKIKPVSPNPELAKAVYVFTRTRR